MGSIPLCQPDGDVWRRRIERDVGDCGAARNSESDLQLIMICGKNAKIRERIAGIKTRNKIHLEGFTKEIPYFMSLCDFFVGKPGPGSISEAIKMKLPVFVERNSWTLPQERYNADWVMEQGVGVVLENFTDH